MLPDTIYAELGSCRLPLDADGWPSARATQAIFERIAGYAGLASDEPQGCHYDQDDNPTTVRCKIVLEDIIMPERPEAPPINWQVAFEVHAWFLPRENEIPIPR